MEKKEISNFFYHRKGFLRILTGCLMLGILIGIVILLQEESVAAKLNEYTSGRLELWKLTVQGYLHLPWYQKIIGVGPDGYCEAIGKEISPYMLKITGGIFEDAVYANAHNEWLTLLINGGICGVIAYGGLFVCYLVQAGKRLWERPIHMMGMVCVVGYLICSMTTFQQVMSTPYLFAMIGINCAGMRKEQDCIESHGLKKYKKAYKHNKISNSKKLEKAGTV